MTMKYNVIRLHNKACTFCIIIWKIILYTLKGMFRSLNEVYRIPYKVHYVLILNKEIKILKNI